MVVPREFTALKTVLFLLEGQSDIHLWHIQLLFDQIWPHRLVLDNDETATQFTKTTYKKYAEWLEEAGLVETTHYDTPTNFCSFYYRSCLFAWFESESKMVEFKLRWS